MEKMSKADFPTSFGIFSPTGHVVIAFENDADARNARQALITGGIGVDEITVYRSDEVLSQIEGSRKTDNKIFQIGQEEEKVKRYDELANQGCGFLVVYAPSDEDSNRVMEIVHPLKPKFAEKYNRLTLEELA
jgi:phosphoribosylaminoimidazole (AIR) synthetase